MSGRLKGAWIFTLSGDHCKHSCMHMTCQIGQWSCWAHRTLAGSEQSQGPQLWHLLCAENVNMK